MENCFSRERFTFYSDSAFIPLSMKNMKSGSLHSSLTVQMCRGSCRLSHEASALISFVFIRFRGKQSWQEEKADVKHFASGLYIASIPAGMEEMGDIASTFIISSSSMLLIFQLYIPIIFPREHLQHTHTFS